MRSPLAPTEKRSLPRSRDNAIKIWDLETGALRNTLEGHADMVWSVAISPDGQTLVSGSRDNAIKIWDLATGNLRNTLESHTGMVTSLAFSADGRRLVSSTDTTIKVWQLLRR